MMENWSIVPGSRSKGSTQWKNRSWKSAADETSSVSGSEKRGTSRVRHDDRQKHGALEDSFKTCEMVERLLCEEVHALEKKQSRRNCTIKEWLGGGRERRIRGG
jgi:hypothetical protein